MTPERWRQIEELYHRALELEESRRAEFLQEACAGDRALQDEVGKLLAEERPTVNYDAHTHLGPGAQLGSYRIEALIGAGGMGEVFCAVDTRLGRKVAIKVSSQQFTRRFDREARVISALNHPHICTLYDVGPNYFVMELVEGENLAARLKKGPLPMQLVLRYGEQIADALAAAHAQGITHRDLKPANIMVTKSGVKVLDFGLAKITRPVGAPKQSESTALTANQAVMGTLGYMAPEQLEGQDCDARSDIFSLGLVLYEMATGRKVFSGDSQAALIADVMRCQPAPMESVPEKFTHVVERSLARDPDDRWQTAKDVKAELSWAGKGEAAAQGVSAPPVKVRRWTVPALVAAVVVFSLAGVAYWRLDQSDYFWKNPLEEATFQKITDWPGTELDAAISYDGKLVTFLADRDGFYDAFVTQAGTGLSENLTRGINRTLLHETTRTTGFSADGAQIWLRTGTLSLTGPNLANGPTLSLISSLGGPMRSFLTPQSLNPVWSADGTQLVFHHSTVGDPITLAEPDGRNEKQVLKAREGEHQHYVTFSPDKSYIYFVKSWRSTEADVWRVRADGGMPEQLTHHNSHVAYPVLLDNRTLLYRATSPDGGWAIFGMDVERGISHQLTSGVEEYQSLSASADGRRIVATVANPVANLWRVPITSGVAEESAAQRVAVPAAYATWGRYGREPILYLSGKGGSGGLWEWKDDGKNGSVVPLWNSSAGRVSSGAAISPDGKSLAFAVNQNGRDTLYVTSFDGTGARALAENLDLRNTPSWSPDGQWIAVAADTGEGNRIFKVSAKTGESERLTDKASTNAVWSPDGNRIAYYDWSAGGTTLPLGAIRPDKTPMAMPMIAYRGEREGYRFMPDGKSIVLLVGQFREQDFWLVHLETGERRQLTRLKPGYSIRSFDVSRDGSEILFDRVQENSDIVLIYRK